MKFNLMPPRFWMGILLLLALFEPALPSARAAGADAQAVQKAVSGAPFRAAYVQSLAQKLLGRAATAGEASQWANVWGSGDKGWMDVAAAVAGSPAYFEKMGNDNSQFISGLFSDFVGRAPDAGTEASASLDFLKGGGSRTELAAVVVDTDEFRARTVQERYQQLLGRAATDPEVTAGTAKLSGGGLAALVGTLIASPAFFANSGGTQKGWQKAVNQNLLNMGGQNMGGGTNNGNPMNSGEPLDPPPYSQSGYPVPAAPVGNGPRAPLVQALMTSPEYFASVVQLNYQKFLKRDATPAELSQWVGALQGGSSPTDVLMGVLSSDEYFNRAGGTTTAFMSRLSQDLLGKSNGSGKLGTSGTLSKPSTDDLITMLRKLPRRKK